MEWSVRVLPMDVELTVRAGESVMEAARRQGYFWPTRCRGQALCTACLFDVMSDSEDFGPVGALEREALESLRGFQERRDRRLRLACQARPCGSGVVFKRGVRIADPSPRATGIWS